MDNKNNQYLKVEDVIDALNGVDFSKKQSLKIPIVEAKPIVRSFWRKNTSKWAAYECDYCEALNDIMTPFCPYCGSEMKEEK